LEVHQLLETDFLLDSMNPNGALEEIYAATSSDDHPIKCVRQKLDALVLLRLNLSRRLSLVAAIVLLVAALIDQPEDMDHFSITAFDKILRRIAFTLLFYCT
jgi:hypothetical protein